MQENQGGVKLRNLQKINQILSLPHADLDLKHFIFYYLQLTFNEVDSGVTGKKNEMVSFIEMLVRMRVLKELMLLKIEPKEMISITCEKIAYVINQWKIPTTSGLEAAPLIGGGGDANKEKIFIPVSKEQVEEYILDRLSSQSKWKDNTGENRELVYTTFSKILLTEITRGRGGGGGDRK